MDIADWLPIYRAIVAELGFDTDADVQARDRLAELVGRDPRDGGALDEDRFDGKTVAIAGAAPTLEDDLDLVERVDAVVAASDAGSRLADRGIDPDLVVTDLDGTPDRTVELAKRGVPVAVHAHGDNVPALETYVPELPTEATIGTTQVRPIDLLVNYGGFTDGDRAAFLADELGADRLSFPGWQLDDRDVDPAKRRKLRWAERLLCWLERDRSERFELLDDRRSNVDLDRLDPD